jgi:hypothetical protein
MGRGAVTASLGRGFLLPPALGEGRHRGLARRFVAVRGAADVAVMAARRHSGAFRWRDWHHECGPIIDAVLQHVVIVVAPLAGPA